MAAPEVRAQGAGEIKQPLSTTPPPGPSLFSALQKLLTPPLTLSWVCSLPEGGDPCGRRRGPVVTGARSWAPWCSGSGPAWASVSLRHSEGSTDRG